MLNTGVVLLFFVVVVLLFFFLGGVFFNFCLKIVHQIPFKLTRFQSDVSPLKLLCASLQPFFCLLLWSGNVGDTITA